MGSFFTLTSLLLIYWSRYESYISLLTNGAVYPGVNFAWKLSSVRRETQTIYTGDAAVDQRFRLQRSPADDKFISPFPLPLVSPELYGALKLITSAYIIIVTEHFCSEVILQKKQLQHFIICYILDRLRNSYHIFCAVKILSFFNQMVSTSLCS